MSGPACLVKTLSVPIVLDADVEVAHLAGGVDMKTSFGIEPESLSGVF